MKVLVLYRPNSEHERGVLDFSRDLNRVTGHTLELVSTETPQGADMARLYDITRYPAILAIKDDGQLLQVWQDELLPTINEVSAYFSTA